ncbi:hypothetical protein [Pedobacter sp. L105]|uniref:hypothetical protein n=1 Tax=Pedobacter sp. L105 TaxID=1641871 RepID=UPI00131A8744|nr:hypothetical protein [Pedobacter sp. L105]
MKNNSYNFGNKTRLILFLSFLLFFSLFIVDAQRSFAQSRSGLGISFGENKPFAYAYKFGTSVALQGNIAFNSKWGFEPSIG